MLEFVTHESMISQTTFLNSVYESVVETRTFDEIYSLIKYDENLKVLTDEYRNTSFNNEHERKEFKRKFPVFFPSVWLGYGVTINKLTINSVPTGLIQFDVDLKDNPELNIEQAILNLVTNTPCLAYCFVSPSGGLKLGLRTDFRSVYNEVYTLEQTLFDTCERYREAYQISKAYLVSLVPELKLDPSVRVLKFDCFLAHDPSAYFNLRCAALLLNDRCFCSHTPKERLHTYETVDYEGVAKLLSYIPRDYRYHDRFSINCSVFNSIGEIGIDLLYNHWTTENRNKLKSDLLYQSKHPTRHNLGYLFNQAKMKGYPKATTGKARKKLVARDLGEASFETQQWISKMIGLDEARLMIKKEVEMFKKTGQDTYLNTSVGSGKTQVVLEVFNETPFSEKILYIGRDHKLLDEIEERFKQIPKERTFATSRKSTMIHLKGKTLLCERPEVIETYNKENMPIPPIQCLKDCHLFDTCRYISQFQSLDNIRAMTHNDLINQEAFFSKTILSNGKEIKLNWKPDYIIVDEDWLQKEEFEENYSSRYQSISRIINDCAEGIRLEKSIEAHFEQIISDYRTMKSDSRKQSVKFENMNQWIRDSKKIKSTNSEILATLVSYAISQDITLLKGLKFDADKKVLKLSRRKPLQDRYQNVPKLFLDATADEFLIKHLMPGVHFVNICVKKNPNTKIYQSENFIATKNWLKDEEHRILLINGLKKIIDEKGYKNVGLITYLNVDDIKKFDQWLAEQLGCKVWGHFGKIRGTNEFENVDCLLVVGRHEINQGTLESLNAALYGLYDPGVSEMVEMPVRLVGDMFCMIENRVSTDTRTQSIRRHYCQAETIQAIGRSRWFNDVEKDVWLFSSESLGLGIEIDGFFRYETWFENSQKLRGKTNLSLKGKTQDEEHVVKRTAIQKNKAMNKKLDYLKDLNLTTIKDKPSSLQELGFSKTFSTDRKARKELFEQGGFRLEKDTWVRDCL